MAEETPLVFPNFRPNKPARTRPANKEPKHGQRLTALTVNLVDTFAACSDSFRYTLQLAPRRVLTKLSKGVHNQGYDNAEHDYICRVCDKIVNPDGDTYEILERLGHGTFGQVLKCVKTKGSGMNDDERQPGPIALKIIKNKPAYFHQALVEVHILKMLNSKHDPEDNKRIVRMLDFFVYRKHLCIAFELLSVNLYDVLKQNSFRGVSMALIRVLTEQLLKAMQCLREAFIIHCDLKPENVLLTSMQHTRIKLIDFGSACFENHTVYSYIQSRFYRSPEVLLGLPYTTAIDMWSLGCICAELFLGLPIFPGHSEYDQVCRIAEVCGLPPAHMLEAGKCTRKYFRRMEEPFPIPDGDGELASGSSDCGGSEHSGQGVLILENIVKQADQRPLEQSPRTDDDDRQESTGSIGGRLEEDWTSDNASAQAVTRDGEENAGASGSFAKADPSPPPAAAATKSPAKSPQAGSFSKERPDQEAITEVEQGAAASAVPEPTTEQVSAAAAAASAEQAPRGETFLDLLKRKVGLTSEGAPIAWAPASSAAAPAPPSSSGSAGGGTAVSESEGGSVAAGSTVSTAPDSHEAVQRRLFAGANAPAASASDASEAAQPQRRAASGDHSEADRREGSSDGRGEVRASGSSDGGAAPGGAEGPPRIRRHQVRRSRRVRILHRLKTREEYERDEHKKEPTPKKYFDFKSLEQMVEHLPYKHNMSRRARAEEQERRQCFLSFLWGVLDINPDVRYTPKQAAHNPFITGAHFNRDFVPPDDVPVPSFTQRMDARGRDAAKAAQNAEIAAKGVPRLDPEALNAGIGGQPEGFSGGGSARTYKENAPEVVDGQPRSAPSTFRGAGGSTEKKVDGSSQVQVPDPAIIMPQVPQHAMRGLWGHLCAGVPLPDDNPAESYRPPIEKLSEEFFRNGARNHVDAQANAAWRHGGSQASQASAKPGPWSNSAGNTSASSAGSTPTHGHRKQRTAQPAPVAATAGNRRQQQQVGQQGMPRSGVTGTPSSSASHGNVSPHSVLPVGPLGSGTPNSNASHTPQQGVPHTAPGARAACTSGSRDGSRGSSPWHLPSPMSELSTASDRVNSSQPSGSDSCGENLMPHDGGTQCSFNEWSGEDPSHSDGHWPRQASDSDGGTMTPQSDTLQGTGRDEQEKGAAKDPRDALWENIKAEMARVELSRDKLPRRLDITQSPGSAGAMGNFREKMGMNESGPVIPFGPTARRDGNAAGAAAGYGGVFTPPQVGGLGQGSLGSSHGSHGGSHHSHTSSSGRRRLKSKPTGSSGAGAGTPPGAGEPPRGPGSGSL